MSQHKLACEAVLWKHGYSFSTADDEIIPGSWNGAELSQAEIDTAVSDYVAHLDAVAYREDRRDAYSPVGDQLDVIWKWLEAEGLVPDTSDSRDLNTAAGMLGAVKAVKAAHPKGD
jgi:hypothetical protein